MSTDVTPADKEGGGEHEHTPSPVQDDRVNQQLQRLHAEQVRILAERRARGAPSFGDDTDPTQFAEVAYPLQQDARDLVYLLARATGAQRIVECATSLGISTMHLAAAVRDNGGGQVIGSELLPTKAAAARANLTAVGLADYVDIREGDARATLTAVGGPIDLVLLDGWPTDKPPSLALSALRILIPQLRARALVLNDNGERDYLHFVRDPANNFRTQHLYFESRHVELSLYDPALPPATTDNRQSNAPVTVQQSKYPPWRLNPNAAI